MPEDCTRCACIRKYTNSQSNVSSLIATLTPRQYDAFLLLGLGMSNTQIAKVMGRHENTAKAHVGAVLVKLGIDRQLAGLVAAHWHDTACQHVPNGTRPISADSRS